MVTSGRTAAAGSLRALEVARAGLGNRPAVRLALNASLVGVACYTGNLIAATERFPQIGSAIAYVPYAVLAAALILSPARHWWLYLLASWIAHDLPHARSYPLSWMLLADVANTVRVLVAAGGVRYFSAGVPRLNTLRSVLLFLLFAVLLGPCVAAVAGAGVVVLRGAVGGASSNYWIVWEAWFLSNALTGLTLLPVLLIAAGNARAWTDPIPVSRAGEATLLAAGLLSVGMLVFHGQYGGVSDLPAQLYMPLPFLLWAAVRFGVGGAGASMLLVTVLIIWGAARGQGPFIMRSPGENLLSLQIFLMAVSAPLLILAAAAQEREQALAALRDGGQQMAMALAAADLGVWSWSGEDGSVAGDARARELLGLAADETASYAALLERLHPADRGAFHDAIQGSLAGGAEFDVRCRIARAPGEFRWLAVRGRAQVGAHGKRARMEGVVFDVTQQKRAEAEARQHLAEVAHLSRVSSVAQMATSFAHELNQPLGAILSNAGAAEMLLDAIPPDLAEVREILADIRKDDRWAGEIVGSMRALLRRREYEPQTLSLNDLVAATVRLVGHDASLRHVSIQLELAPALPAVRGDPVHLQQALINLLVNGMDAMNGGACADPRLVVETTPGAGWSVQVTVSDNGPGIAAGAIAHLFEPFYTTKEEGLGMGLSIARAVLEMHGGEIEAENRSGGGAVFRLLLPCAEGA